MKLVVIKERGRDKEGQRKEEKLRKGIAIANRLKRLRVSLFIKQQQTIKQSGKIQRQMDKREERRHCQVSNDGGYASLSNDLS